MTQPAREAMQRALHAVAETEAYLSRCRVLGLSAEERARVVDQVAADPSDGAVIRGSGGVRKVRFGGSGGYRVMVAYLGEGAPAYLLSILSKGQQANFTPQQIAVMQAMTRDLKQVWRRKREGGHDD